MPWQKYGIIVSAALTSILVIKWIGVIIVKMATQKFQTIDGCKGSAADCVTKNIQPMCNKIDKIQETLKSINEHRINDKVEAIAARKVMEEKLAIEVKENREIVDSHYAELNKFMGLITGKLDILINK